MNDNNTNNNQNVNDEMFGLGMNMVYIVLGFIALFVILNFVPASDNRNEGINDQYADKKIQENVLEEEEEYEEEYEEVPEETQERKKYVAREPVKDYSDSTERWALEEEEREKDTVSWLKKYGFKENNDFDLCKRYKDYTCFVKGDFAAVVGRSPYTYYYKSINTKSLKGYDFNKDVVFFEKLFGFDIPNDVVKELGDYVDTFTYDGSHNFTLHIYDIDFNFYLRDNYIEYMFDRGSYYQDDSIEPSYIDIFNSGNTLEAKNNNMKTLYNIIMFKNKDFYNFYDYASIHFEGDSSGLCRIEYETKDRYIFKSSFCHGGTSTMYFEAKKDNRLNINYDSITIEYKNEAFKTNYLDLISKDLDYFNNKLEKNYKLTSDDINTIRNFIDNEEEKISLIMGYNLQMEIERKYNDFYITYIIR